MVPSEFQAIVMALGRGSRMTDVTAQCAKPLLPVGGVPMLWYPLNLLEKSGFKEVIVITGEAMRPKIQNLVDSGKLKTSLELAIVAIPDEEYGTAESLRFIHDKIKMDILVISCDLILDAPLHPFENLHRLHNSSFTAFFAPIPSELKEAKAPGYKGGHMIERDFVAIDTEDKRLLFISSEADLDETLAIRKSLLIKHPNMLVHSQLMDAHLYLMKKWVVDYLVKFKPLATLKGEVVPHLIKKQFQQSSTKNGNDSAPGTNASIVSFDMREDIYSYATEDPLLQKVRELSSWNDHSGDMDACYHGNTIRCYAYVDSSAFCIRANTLASYFEANKQILKRGPLKSSDDEKPKAVNAQVDKTSVIGSGTSLETQASVKMSSIGPNCHIGEQVRLVNCVVMAGVKIESRSNIENSILCANVTIGNNCKIKDSLIAAGQKVLEGTKITREVVSDSTKMMEIV